MKKLWHWLTLPSTEEEISIGKRVLKRYRIIIVLSIVVNAYFVWNMRSMVNRNGMLGAVIQYSQRLSEFAQAQSNLYQQQQGHFALAHTLYGELHQPEKSLEELKRIGNSYNKEIDQFNVNSSRIIQISGEMTTLSNDLHKMLSRDSSNPPARLD